MKYKIGFIGAGHMAQALISAIANEGVADKSQMYLYDIDNLKRDKLRAEGYNMVKSELEVVKSADIVFLTVRPHDLKKVLERIAPAVSINNVLVSVAAGISISFIKKTVGKECKVVRAMPNTPAKYGKGATAISYAMPITYAELNAVKDIFAAAGLVEVLPEDKMNEVISVSGSSPAYVYMLIKAMVNGAVAQGIEPEIARRLVMETIIGATETVVREGDENIDQLLKEICTPNGTTERAVDYLEKKYFEQIIGDAMLACTKRAAQIEKEIGEEQE